MLLEGIYAHFFQKVMFIFANQHYVDQLFASKMMMKHLNAAQLK